MAGPGRATRITTSIDDERAGTVATAGAPKSETIEEKRARLTAELAELDQLEAREAAKGAADRVAAWVGGNQTQLPTQAEVDLLLKVLSDAGFKTAAGSGGTTSTRTPKVKNEEPFNASAVQSYLLKLKAEGSAPVTMRTIKANALPGQAMAGTHADMVELEGKVKVVNKKPPHYS